MHAIIVSALFIPYGYPKVWNVAHLVWNVERSIVYVKLLCLCNEERNARIKGNTVAQWINCF